MAKISYDEQTIAHPNPIARFAHKKRYENSLALVGKQIHPGATVLDFGAGQGEFLYKLKCLHPGVHAIAYEPFQTSKYDIEYVTSIDSIESDTVDVLCAFEVIEHLTDNSFTEFIRQAQRICKPDGRLIISVPIMLGLALPVKEAVRSMLFRRPSDYNLIDIFRGTFGFPVTRTSNVLYSHKGFDFRNIFKSLSVKFKCTQVTLSPFASLPWWCNSQAFYSFSIAK